MFLSVFDIFKIGIGPSSSHTMGPMIAAARFLLELKKQTDYPETTRLPERITCSLHGSLAFTGKGHSTDRAVILGLIGCRPDTMNPDDAEWLEAAVYANKCIEPHDLPKLFFDPNTDLIYEYGPPLPGHANGMVIRAFDADGSICLEETYYSVGGGFVVTANELNEANKKPDPAEQSAEIADCPYPFQSAAQMLEMSGIGLKATEGEVRGPRHGLRQGDRGHARLDAATPAPDIDLDQHGQAGTGNSGRPVERRHLLQVIDTNRNLRLARQGRGTGELGRPDHLIGDQDVAHAALDHDLGLADFLAADPDRAAGHLIEADQG